MLIDYRTGIVIRKAKPSELLRSATAARRDAVGVILVDGRPCLAV